MFRRRHAIRSCLVLVTLHGCFAAAAAELPTAEEVHKIYQANQKRLAHLHLQVVFECENAVAADREAKRELDSKLHDVKTLRHVIKGDTTVRLEINGERITPEKAKQLLAELVGPEWEKEIEELEAKAAPYRGVTPMELFIDGQDYQFRRPVDTLARDDQTRARLRTFPFPARPVSPETLLSDYRHMAFFSHSAQADPPSRSWWGNEKEPYACTSNKELGDNMNVDLPPFAAVMSPPDCRSANRHPIDEFFLHPAADYQVVGQERLDGRMLTIVELTVADSDRSLEVFRAWLDLNRGALPVKIEKRYALEDWLPRLDRWSPSEITRTERIVALPNGAFYPAETTWEKWSDDADRGLSSAEWDEVRAHKRRAPELLTRAYRWNCGLVEIKTDFANNFFVIPFLPGQKVYDRDASDEPKNRKPQVEVGQQAPPLTVGRWLDGKERTLDDLKGQVVVLDFWALWCSGCRAEVPKLNALAKQFRDKPVTFIAIHNPEEDLDDLAKRIEEFRKKSQWTWIAAIDAGTEEDSKTGDDYGVLGLPLMVIIDRSGKIVHVDFMAETPDSHDVEAQEELEKKLEEFTKHEFEVVGEKWPISDELSEKQQSDLMHEVHWKFVSRVIEAALPAKP